MSFFKSGLSDKPIELDASRLRVLLSSLPLPPDAVSAIQNVILLIPSGSGAVQTYPKTATGLTNALSDASSGDMIWIPPCTLAGNYTVPAGVMVRGSHYSTVLSGTITNNGVVINVRITGTISNGTSTAYYRVYDGSSIDHTVYGTAVDLRWQFGYSGATPSFTVLSLAASGKAGAIIAGTGGAGLIVQNDGPLTLSEDSRANFLADNVGQLGGGSNIVNMAIFPTTGNLRLERTGTFPLYSDPGYKLYVGGTGRFTGQISSTLATGTAPLAVSSTTVNTNLNADMVDGQQASEFIDHADISESDGFLRKTGAAAYEAIKTNLSASTAPGTGDDSGDGYAVGSRWIDTTADKEYVCLDASLGAAVWTETTGGGSGTDADAIHDNVSGEINAITEKASPVTGDILLIEDSAASYAKKKVQIGNLPTGSDADAIHDNVSGEIAAITEKASPVNGDIILIEDSADSNSKKRVQIGNLPSGSGDSTFTVAYASRPAAGSDGDLFFPSDGFYVERDTGAAWVPWGPLYPLKAPVDGDFAWINQGGASVSTTNGGIKLSVPADAGGNNRIRKKTAPATPYTITIAFQMAWFPANYFTAGLLFRQSSDGKLVRLGLQYNTSSEADWRIIIQKWNGVASYSADYITPVLPYNQVGLTFLRIEDNGTNRLCYFSPDKQNWVQLHSVGRTDFLTADEVGFYGDVVNGTYSGVMNLLSWEEA